jgi:hypothetical protein
MKNLINELSKIQKTLKAPKNQRNIFGKYNYRSCEDILEAVKPLIPEDYNLRIKDELVNVGERYYIKATAIFSDGENEISSEALAREAINKKGMDESQITGACSSYARKYALNGLFLIDDTKDADTIKNKENEILDLIAQVDSIDTLEELKAFYQVNKGKGKEFDASVSRRKAELSV